MTTARLARFRHFCPSLALVAVGLFASTAQALPTRAAATAQERITYVRVGEAGAKAYNLADTQAVPVRELEAKTVLAVHAEGSIEAEKLALLRAYTAARAPAAIGYARSLADPDR